MLQGAILLFAIGGEIFSNHRLSVTRVDGTARRRATA